MRHAHWILRASVVALVACSEGSFAPDPIDGDFAEQRAKWDALGIDDYDLEIVYGTTWVGSLEAVRVSVRNGAITNCAHAKTLQPVTNEFRCISLDGLHQRIEDVATSMVPARIMTFDRTRGYVTMAYFDNESMADEEYWYEVKRFIPR